VLNTIERKQKRDLGRESGRPRIFRRRPSKTKRMLGEKGDVEGKREGSFRDGVASKGGVLLGNRAVARRATVLDKGVLSEGKRRRVWGRKNQNGDVRGAKSRAGKKVP